MNRIAYLDCMSGISGDMMLGALVDAGVDLGAIQRGVDSLGLPGCRLVAEPVKRRGFRGTKVRVEHEPEHAHRHLHHITAIIDRSTLTDRQKELARRMFTALGEAEAKVHGTTIEKVHFHEVGAVDSIADIVGSAIGLDLLDVRRIDCSAVPTGHGTVEIAHGRVSIPAPATAELLRQVPLAPSPVEAELTTPTGAAIVATVVERFGPLPSMTIQSIGYGAGDRDFSEQPNLLRLIVGTQTAGVGSEQVWTLETNLDDLSGEVIGYCSRRLFEAGALDVYTTAVQMKKNRPGVVVSVLCREADIERLEQILFAETTTLGIRRWPAWRSVLERSEQTVQTRWGPIPGKLARTPDGTVRFSPEYEACRVCAEQHQVPLRTVIDDACRALEAG